MNKKKTAKPQIKFLKNPDKSQLFSSKTPEILNFLNQSPSKALSPVPFSQNSYQNLVKQLSLLSITKNHLISEINESLSEKNNFERQNSFHKMKEFIDRKIQIKQNVKDHKFKSSENLFKLKTIIESEPQPKAFITKEDMISEQSAEFLSLNKRNFGESAKMLVSFKQRKKQAKGNNRTPSLPEVPSSSQKSVSFSPRKSVDLALSSNTNKYIMTEMKKMFPSEVNLVKKRGILNTKIEKIDLILQDPSSQRVYAGQKQVKEKQKRRDTIVNHHLQQIMDGLKVS